MIGNTSTTLRSVEGIYTGHCSRKKGILLFIPVETQFDIIRYLCFFGGCFSQIVFHFFFHDFTQIVYKSHIKEFYPHYLTVTSINRILQYESAIQPKYQISKSPKTPFSHPSLQNQKV